MSVNLASGQKLSLTKGNPGLKNVVAGLGWTVNAGPGMALDLDVSAFLLTASGKVSDSKDFVFYGNLSHHSGAVVHTDGEAGGNGDTDKAKIKIDFSKVPENIIRIAVTATIYDAETRKQTFERVGSAYIRIYDELTGQEILRYDLEEKRSGETAVVFGELYKNNGEWKFNAMGSGYRGGLAALCVSYGIEVD